MSKEISVEKLVGSVMKLEIGKQLDEAIAKEVFGMRKNGILQDVKDPFNGQPSGQSFWITENKVPVHLPKFSTVPFVASLMLADMQKAVRIERTDGDEMKGEATYFAGFVGDNGSGVPLQGKTFAEAVARAVLFEARFAREFENIIKEVMAEGDTEDKGVE